MHRTKRSGRLALAIFLFIFVAASCAFSQVQARTVQMNLAQLVERSATIVHGKVISAHLERHPELTNLDTIVVTLRVLENMKGNEADTFTFHQFVWNVRNARSPLGYVKGQEMMLMMTKPSRYGLSSPVGVGQGRFRITRDKAGKAFASNDSQNAFLFRDLGSPSSKAGAALPSTLLQRAQTNEGGPVLLDDLKQAIKGLAGVKK